MSVNRPFTRHQRTTIIHGMLAFVVMLVMLQLWLLTATMNAYLGGDESVIWPAATSNTLRFPDASAATTNKEKASVIRQDCELCRTIE